MLKNNTGRSSRFGKPSFARGGGSRNGSSGFKPRMSRGGGFGGGRGKGQSISISRFICKAEPVAEKIAYESKNKFADFAICELLKENIAAKGYITPTPIQDQTIPAILNGADMVGVANTGTGKTAAFLIPLLNKVAANPNEKVLIIVPTRELASQINQEFIDFRGALKVFSVCCFGGAYIGQQLQNLKRPHNFVIGTPGRLKDLVERGAIKLESFTNLVLDEADRMLDMGFVNDMRFIVSKMAPKKQALLFSATITHEIDSLINEFLTNPITVSVKTGDTAKNVDQDVVRVGKEDKLDTLHNMLKLPEFSKVLIFGRTKHGVERLSKTLTERGIKAESIHGDKNQSGRERALRAFKENHSRILVATDVAARGLDIPNVSHVVNYDIPATYEDYVHRIGRTGRGDKTGKALTFID